MPITERTAVVVRLSRTLSTSKKRCIELLEAANGDENRAAELFFDDQQGEHKQQQHASPPTLSHPAPRVVAPPAPAAVDDDMPALESPVAAHAPAPKQAPPSHSLSSPSAPPPKPTPSLFSSSTFPSTTSLFSSSTSSSPPKPHSSSTTLTQSSSRPAPPPPPPSPPPVDPKVTLRILDMVDPSAPSTIIRFPRSQPFKRLFDELEKRGYRGVRLYSAKVEVDGSFTARELCLVDHSIVEMEYTEKLGKGRAGEGAGGGVGAKRDVGQVQGPAVAGGVAKRSKGDTGAALTPGGPDDSLPASASISPPPSSSPVSGAAPGGAPAPPQPAPQPPPPPRQNHEEAPVSFTELLLGQLTFSCLTNAKVFPKSMLRLQALLSAVASAVVLPYSALDRDVVEVLTGLAHIQRVPVSVTIEKIGVRERAAEEKEMPEDEQPPSDDDALDATNGDMRDDPDPYKRRRRVKKSTAKYVHSLRLDVHLLPGGIGWCCPYMNQLLSLLWGHRFESIMMAAYSPAYRPGDGKACPSMDASSLLQISMRTSYAAALTADVFSPPHSARSARSSASSSSGATAFIPPHEASEVIGLRYLVQREQASSSPSEWLEEKELDEAAFSTLCRVRLHLRDYQQQSVLWMLGQELRRSIAEPFWLELTVDGARLLYSPLFQHWRMGPIEAVRGGLLCDSMGLGKTISTLALINLHPAPPSFYGPPSSPSSSPPSYSTPDPSNPIRSRATLIIAPVTLLGQWEAELRKHSDHPLRIYSFYGSNRLHDAHKVADFDVVLTTPGVLASDSSGLRLRRRVGKPSIFHCIEWWRVVCDEAHQLKDTATLQSRAARDLLSQQRWVLTGTPVSQSVMELRGLFIFLHCLVLADTPPLWTALDAAARPADLKPSPLFPPHALHAIASLIFTRLVMRHVKDQPFNDRAALTTLPPRHTSTTKVDFTAEQRAAYDEMWAYARARFDALQARGEATKRTLEALSYLLPLRQACSGGLVDIGAMRRREEEAKKREEEEAKAQAAAMPQPLLPPIEDDADEDEKAEAGSNRRYPYARTAHYGLLDDDCVVCLNPFDMPVQTECGHLLCLQCIDAMFNLDGPNTACPHCRAIVNKSALRRPRPPPPPPPKPPTPPPEPAPFSPSSSSSSAPSSPPAVSPSQTVLFNAKLDVILLDLQQLQREDPSTKVLVFSQFASTLSYLEGRLSALSIPTLRITGDMSMTRRKRVLTSFNTSPTFSVFLLSVRVGAVGLTLTAANHVIVVEPSMNWALTEQAVNRVHRLGQRREVYIRHMMMKGSVEEKMERVTRDKREGKEGRGMGGGGEGVGGGGVKVEGRGKEERKEEEDGELGLGSVVVPAMGSMRKDAADYRLQELQTLFER